MKITEGKQGETVPGAERGPTGRPRRASRPLLPAAPSPRLPASPVHGGGPAVRGLTGTKGQSGTDPGPSSQTAPRRAAPLTRGLELSPSPALLPRGWHPGTGAGALGLSCPFCKVAPSVSPSGVAMRDMAEGTRGRAWDRAWPKAGAHEQ